MLLSSYSSRNTGYISTESNFQVESDEVVIQNYSFSRQVVTTTIGLTAIVLSQIIELITFCYCSSLFHRHYYKFETNRAPIIQALFDANAVCKTLCSAFHKQ